MKYLFFLFLSIAFSSYGQEWTLQQCVDQALKSNIQVKQTELSQKLNEVQLEQRKAALLPNLNANAAHFYNYGQTIDPFTNQFASERVLSQRFSLNSSVTLFSGFQNVNSIRQAKFAYLAGKYDVEKFKNDIALSVVSAYLQVLFNQELVKTTRNQLEVTKQQKSRTEKLFEAGTVAKGTLLDVESQLASDEVRLINAENQRDLSLLNLAQLMELDDMKNFKIGEPDLKTPDEVILADPSQTYAAAIKNMPEIKSAEYKIRGSEQGLNIARGGLSPTLMLSGSYGTGYSGASRRLLRVEPTGFDTTGFTTQGDYVLAPSFNPVYESTPFRDQIEDNQNKSFGFNLSIPLFNNFQNKANISRAKIDLQRSQLDLELTKNQLEKNIETAYTDAKGALKKYTATKKTVEALNESFKYAEQRFNVGILSSYEYNQSKNNVGNAESEMLQAKYDYFFKLKVLDFYSGKPLNF